MFWDKGTSSQSPAAGALYPKGRVLRNRSLSLRMLREANPLARSIFGTIQTVIKKNVLENVSVSVHQRPLQNPSIRVDFFLCYTPININFKLEN